MRKKISIFALLCILSVTSILLTVYRDHGRKQAYNYAMHLVEYTHLPAYNREPVITKDVQIEKIVKQIPFDLVFLIKWRDNEKAYASINNWMTKAHDTIEVHVVDKSKFIVIYE
jgi:hypothetical protein